MRARCAVRPPTCNGSGWCVPAAVCATSSAEVLDDGHGCVDARLLGLHEGLCAMAVPHNGRCWLGQPAVRERLRRLVSGEVALTHDGVDTLAAGLGREYLRELLVAHRVLPARDKYLAAFERWTTTRLDTVPAGEDRQLIRTYLAWHHHRRLRERAELGLLHESTAQSARQQTNVAVAFLARLAERGRSLADCRQADIDEWFATGTTTRWALRNFLTWAIVQRRCPALEVPRYRGRSAPALSQQVRLVILNRLFTDTDVELSDRVAGCLVLIYAQPIARIRTLTVDDLDRRGQETWIRFAREHVPLPEPVGELATTLAATARRNMATAANPTSPWLFPGRAPTQAVQAEQPAERLARLGISRVGRLAALNSLVAQVPGPVLGQLIGYSATIIAQHASAQGVDWASYAALKSRERAH